MAKNFTPIDDLIKKFQVGRMGKEAGPVTGGSELSEIQEVVEQKIEKEVEPFITQRAETIKLPSVLKKIGVQPSVTTTSFPTYQAVKIPLADEKVLLGMHAPITSSLRWLATLALYILQTAHLTLKKIHGKVVRVVRS